MYTYIHTYIHSILAYIHRDVYVCMSVFVCMYMYACICMHVYVCMYMYVCMYVCICMCVCMYGLLLLVSAFVKLYRGYNVRDSLYGCRGIKFRSCNNL